MLKPARQNYNVYDYSDVTAPKEFWRQRLNRADDRNLFNNYGVQKPITRHRSIVELS